MKKILSALLGLLLSGAVEAGTLYVDTGGNAANSGSTDTNSPTLTGSAATVASTVVSLDGSPDLSGVVTTAGATQSTIFLADATNSNQKIFWITAKDDDLDTVTVSVAPTGVVSSAWRIGGRHVLTNASIEGALRAGDTVIFNNSPASGTGVRWTFRTAGTTAAGYCTIRGKTGVRPTLTTTDTANCIAASSALAKIQNLQLVQQGASGNAILLSGSGLVENVKITDFGGAGITMTSQGNKVLNSEITGGDGVAIDMGTASGGVIAGNYIHDNAAGAIANGGTSPSLAIVGNIFDTNGTGAHINLSGSIASQQGFIFVYGNTFYGNNTNALITADADASAILQNNIFLDNGDTGTEYNVNWPSGDLANNGYSGYNVYSQAGARGGTNVVNFTLGATDLTSDPLITDEANADFTLATTSPAKATGYPGAFIGGSTSYLDMGAVQRQEGAGDVVESTGGCTEMKVGGGGCGGISIQ